MWVCSQRHISKPIKVLVSKLSLIGLNAFREEKAELVLQLGKAFLPVKIVATENETMVA
jgi:hypothetical protein